jgi:hypothetical protein
MIQVPPNANVVVMHEPINFRNGIEGTAAIARTVLDIEPMDGAFFVFRSRRRHMLRVLFVRLRHTCMTAGTVPGYGGPGESGATRPAVGISRASGNPARWASPPSPSRARELAASVAHARRADRRHQFQGLRVAQLAVAPRVASEDLSRTSTLPSERQRACP